MLPAVAHSAMEAASNEDTDISEFAAIVERDVKLASDTLSLANSAAYAPATPILNLHQAVAQLGFQTCQNLILASSVSSLMRQTTLQQSWIRELLWQHAITTALGCLRLNQQLGCGFFGEEFTAGLMHDIGRLLFAAELPKQFSVIDSLSFDESPSLLDDEIAVCGTSHAELGAWYLELNRLPAPLVDVARFHHQPELAKSNHRLVCLTAAADHLANHLQRTEGTDGYVPAENGAIAILERSGVRRAAMRFENIWKEVAEGVMQDAATMASF